MNKRKSLRIRFCKCIFFSFLISGGIITFFPILFKLLNVKPFAVLPWFSLPWQYTNVTDIFNGEEIIIEGYGLSILMPISYYILSLLTIFFCMCVNRGGFCCILHIKNKKMRENHHQFDDL